MESIYEWRAEESAMGPPAGWNDWMHSLFFRSVLSNAVALTSLFFHHLGWALINAIKVIFLLAWSGRLTQGTL